MKSLFDNLSKMFAGTCRKTFPAILFIVIGLSHAFAQTYNPQTGNTHYPNGTIYIGTSEHTGGPVVTGPDREDGSWERVECDKDAASEKRCAEILEEASPDKDGNTTDSGGSSTNASTQSLGAEIASEVKEYRNKQLKIKYGVWAKQNGKWQHIKNPDEWTAAIISSWKKKK